ncbi:MAG: GTP-binding protein, partial [Winogradskyella sp.]|nr:GTP-binding protein [Winogradskyella sp.]
QDYSLQLFGLLMMVVLWFALYAAGRLGRAKGKPEMHKLYEFMNVVIASYR